MSTSLPAEPLRKLRLVADRSKRISSVRFPVEFVREQVTGERPPLARLVRAGEVRLKLHLTLALMATRQPYELREPPAAYWFASMLGLSNHETSGARRVGDALAWLEREHFIERTPRPGKTSKIKLLHHGSTSAAGGRYLQAPLDLWKQGWLLALPARAIGLYLVLKEATGGRADHDAMLSGTRKAQYYLSDETWARGAKDLEDAGLLHVEETFARASSKDEYEPKRRRLRYTLLDSVIASPPGTPADSSGGTGN